MCGARSLPRIVMVGAEDVQVCQTMLESKVGKEGLIGRKMLAGLFN
jgi:hypothetical protein